MANTQSDFISGKKSLPQPDSASIRCVPVELTLAAAPALNDTIELLELQPGVQLVEFDIIAPQIDSNASPLLTISLGAINAGKTDLGAVYADGLTIGRTANGNVTRCADARAYAANPVDNTRIVALKWTAAAATWAGAGKKLLINLHLKA